MNHLSKYERKKKTKNCWSFFTKLFDLITTTNRSSGWVATPYVGCGGTAPAEDDRPNDLSHLRLNSNDKWYDNWD